jgi:biotin operon repressor
MKTAVEWLIEQLKERGYAGEFPPYLLFEQAKAMEKEQMGYSKEDVIKIVEKSRETGLTAEYLLLTYNK